MPEWKDYRLRSIGYMSKIPPSDLGRYLSAVAALRGLYDVADAIKRWESERTGNGKFGRICFYQVFHPARQIMTLHDSAAVSGTRCFGQSRT